MPRRTALITGVSRSAGLGFATARLLAEQNVRVIITARDVARADALAQALRGEGLTVEAAQLDLTDADSISALAQELSARIGVLDILVNNAAGGFDIESSVLDTDIGKAEEAFAVNFFGPWTLTTTLLPLLRRSRDARVVNVSSEAGAARYLGSPEIGGAMPGYSLSKNAMNALTIKMAIALDDERILVNAVCPGETATHPETGDEDNARPAAESARGVLWAALLSSDGPTGGFFRDGRALGW